MQTRCYFDRLPYFGMFFRWFSLSSKIRSFESLKVNKSFHSQLLQRRPFLIFMAKHWPQRFEKMVQSTLEVECYLQQNEFSSSWWQSRWSVVIIYCTCRSLLVDIPRRHHLRRAGSGSGAVWNHLVIWEVEPDQQMWTYQEYVQLMIATVFIIKVYFLLGDGVNAGLHHRQAFTALDIVWKLLDTCREETRESLLLKSNYQNLLWVTATFAVDQVIKFKYEVFQFLDLWRQIPQYQSNGGFMLFSDLLESSVGEDLYRFYWCPALWGSPNWQWWSVSWTGHYQACSASSRPGSWRVAIETWKVKQGNIYSVSPTDLKQKRSAALEALFKWIMESEST